MIGSRELPVFFTYHIKIILVKNKIPGIHLSSHAVASVVLSAVRGLTFVFGMGTGVAPGRIDTRQNFLFLFLPRPRIDNRIAHNPLLLP